MLQALDDYDWREAFAYADPEWVIGTANYGQKGATFDREDVVELGGVSCGENDGAEWIAFGRLKDGRWFFLSAGCDYTGWDCQAGGRSVCAETRELLEARAMTVEERLRMSNEQCFAHEDCKATPELGRACFERSLSAPSPTGGGAT